MRQIGILLLCTLTSVVQAGSPRPGTARITLVFDSKISYDKKLELQSWRNLISSNAGFEVAYLNPVSRNRYEVSVQVEADGSSYIYLYYPGLATLVDLQPVEPLDDVVITIRPGTNGKSPTFSFKGKGSAKFRFNHAIPFNMGIPKMQIFKRDPKRMLLYADSMNTSLQTTLTKTSGISPMMRQLIRDNIKGWIYGNLMDALRLALWDNDLENKEAINEVVSEVGVEISNARVMLSSAEYCKFLYSMSKLKMVLLRGDNQLTSGMSFTFAELYREIKSSYSGVTAFRFGNNSGQEIKTSGAGLIQQKLIAFSVIDPLEMAIYFQGSDPLEFTSVLDDALQTVTDPVYKKAIQHRKEIAGKGSKAFDFKLTDRSGKPVYLHDFKGKVVFVDMWYNPCGACKIFKDSFETVVYPHIRDNPDVVVLSVGLTETKEGWLEAIPEFSNPDFINLYTDGLAIKHPFPAYYGIRTIPFLLLIDREGNIASGTVPYANRADDLLALIQRSLAEPVKP